MEVFLLGPAFCRAHGFLPGPGTPTDHLLDGTVLSGQWREYLTDRFVVMEQQ
jgi:hypothetical protein